MSSAVIQKREVSREPLPVCLWQENPYRPVSLWDIMIPFSAEMWFWAGYALENLKTDCLLKSGLGDEPVPVELLHGPIKVETIEKATAWLKAVHTECSRIGLPVSGETVTELLDSLAGPPHDWEWLSHQLHGLQKMIRKEMKTKSFIYITPEKMRFCPMDKRQDVLGASVSAAFPSTKLEAAEAGVCLALSRATASVFHLMRVLEIGLATLGAVFNVSLAHTNWAPAIDEIEKHIRDMHKDPTWKALPDCKEQQEFYSQAASHFGILKDAWRNYTAHARGVYTEERAALIFDNVA